MIRNSSVGQNICKYRSRNRVVLFALVFVLGMLWLWLSYESRIRIKPAVMRDEKYFLTSLPFSSANLKELDTLQSTVPATFPQNRPDPAITVQTSPSIPLKGTTQVSLHELTDQTICPADISKNYKTVDQSSMRYS
jgi:hypothetical protein